MDKNYFNQLLKITSLIIFLILFFFLGKFFLQYFYPFVFAVLIAIFLNPLVTFFEEKMKLSRLTVTISITVFSICLLLIILFFILSELVQGTLLLLDFLPDYIIDFLSILKSFFLEAASLFSEKLAPFHQGSSFLQNEFFHQLINQLYETIGSTMVSFLKNILSSFHELIIKIPESIVLFIFIGIISILISYEYPYFQTLISEKIPQEINKNIKAFLLELRYLLGKYLKAQVLLSTITFLISFLGLLFVQIQASFAIALFIGFIDFLPIIGPSLIFLPWLIYLFITKNYMLTIKISILYMIIIILRQFIEPKVLSTVFKVRFIYVLLIMFISYKLGGIAGLVFTPLIIILLIALKNIGFYDFLLRFIRN